LIYFRPGGSLAFKLIGKVKKMGSFQEGFTFNVFFYVFVILCVLFLFDLIDIEMIVAWIFVPGIVFWLVVAFIVSIIKSWLN